MKRLVLMLALAAGLCSFGEQEVFRLVRDTETGMTAIIGVDNVARQCHILTPSEFGYVTNMVFKWYAHMNSTREGRAALHGKKEGGVTVTTNDVGTIIKRQAYEDGYVHEETAMVAKKSRPKNRIDARIGGLDAPRQVKIRHPAGISQRQREMREARERIRQKKPREITVNHDANTGKDTVVK